MEDYNYAEKWNKTVKEMLSECDSGAFTMQKHGYWVVKA